MSLKDKVFTVLLWVVFIVIGWGAFVFGSWWNLNVKAPLSVLFLNLPWYWQISIVVAFVVLSIYANSKKE